jgi:hypothetical protein
MFRIFEKSLGWITGRAGKDKRVNSEQLADKDAALTLMIPYAEMAYGDGMGALSRETLAAIMNDINIAKSALTGKSKRRGR